MLKGNKHRDLHNALTDGRISPEEYDKKIKAHERESMRVMLRQNMALKPNSKKPVTQHKTPAKESLGAAHDGTEVK